MSTDGMPWDRAYVVNLARRRDRLAHAMREFKRVGIEVNIMEAVDWMDLPEDAGSELTKRVPKAQNYLAHVACGMSHQEVLREAVRLGVETVAIFEDDVELLPRFRELVTCAAVELESLDPDWEFLYLGHRPWKGHPPTMLSVHVDHVTHTYDAHAYVVRGAAIERILEDWDPRRRTTDWYFHDEVPMRYGVHPPVASQDKTLVSETVVPRSLGESLL